MGLIPVLLRNSLDAEEQRRKKLYGPPTRGEWLYERIFNGLVIVVLAVSVCVLAVGAVSFGIEIWNDPLTWKWNVNSLDDL